MSCAIARKEGIYRRKKRLLSFDPFTLEMHRLIDSTAAIVYAELGRRSKSYARH
jgi:hypothetical protein